MELVIMYLVAIAAVGIVGSSLVATPATCPISEPMKSR